MTTRRLSRADVDREHTYEWLMARDAAETFPCELCRAAPAVTCINVRTGRPLTGQPAHMVRLARAALIPSAPPVLPGSAVPGLRDPSSPASPQASASSAAPAMAA